MKAGGSCQGEGPVSASTASWAVAARLEAARRFMGSGWGRPGGASGAVGTVQGPGGSPPHWSLLQSLELQAVAAYNRCKARPTPPARFLGASVLRWRRRQRAAARSECAHLFAKPPLTEKCWNACRCWCAPRAAAAVALACRMPHASTARLESAAKRGSSVLRTTAPDPANIRHVPSGLRADSVAAAECVNACAVRTLRLGRLTAAATAAGFHRGLNTSREQCRAGTLNATVPMLAASPLRQHGTRLAAAAAAVGRALRCAGGAAAVQCLSRRAHCAALIAAHPSLHQQQPTPPRADHDKSRQRNPSRPPWIPACSSGPAAMR